MDNSKKDKAKLSDEQLDTIVGGIEAIITSTEKVEDGICPKCNGPVYRITEYGTLGPFEITKTHRECPIHGWISV